MSKEINLDTTNLCITEDAFEQFQAGSVYAEDEYITLSDIATTPEEPVLDLSADMTEIPYDNEVELSSNQENTSEISGKADIELVDFPPVSLPEKVIVEQLPQEISYPTEDLHSTGVHSETFVTKSKRGRKRKNANNYALVTNNANARDFIVSQENNVQGNADMTSSVPKTPGRRGRKPKNSRISVSHNGSQSQSEDQTPEAPDVLQKPVRTTGRRGRRPKMPLEETATNTTLPPGNENRLSNVSNSEFDNSDDISLNNFSKKAPAKRGRRKQDFHEETVAAADSQDGTVEDMEVSDLISPSNSETFDNSLSNSFIKAKASKRGRKGGNTSPGKRGRPKRLPPEDIAVGQEQIVSQTDIPTEIATTDDFGDDVSLSRLKATLQTDTMEDININTQINDIVTNIDTEIQLNDSDPDILLDVGGIEDNKIGDTPTKRNSKAPEMPDFEYDIDNVVAQTTKTDNIKEPMNIETDAPIDSFLIEDTSKRPIRRKIKQALHYDEGSDEDPFANIELSDDDEPRRRKKGKKYYSDDEYVPGSKRGKLSSSEDVSDSDIDDVREEMSKFSKRKRNRFSNSQSPRKKGKNTDHNNDNQELSIKTPNVTTIAPTTDGPDDDIEVFLESSVIKANDDPKQNKWGATNEFESFIARKMHGTNLKIKKISSTDPSHSLEIPVLDPNEAKKCVEMCTQTNTVKKIEVGMQTSTPYYMPMKENITMTPEQSEKACDFLKSVVKTTCELGELMTQKSQDFITKKINTSHVTDTFKMDYCVRKSFLLFKLAKHNLAQMEHDLSVQYDEFLKGNGLQKCRQEPKKIEPKPKVADSDSDCEIVEAPPVQVKQEKQKFNPKTVFLNKELSIKIAKKPAATEDKKDKKNINIKNRETVWISDSVMVKKVKPTQSFLAQDSRNKKPPDCYVTEEMVSDFFKEYDRQQAQSMCAPFTSVEWRNMDRSYMCCYFFVKSDKSSSTSTSYPDNVDTCSNHIEDIEASDVNNDINGGVKSLNEVSNTVPETLFSLCTQALQKHFHPLNTNNQNNSHDISDTVTDMKVEEHPMPLFRLCVNKLIDSFKIIPNDSVFTNNNDMPPDNDYNDLPSSLETLVDSPKSTASNDSLSNIDYMQYEEENNDHVIYNSQQIPPLKVLCYRRIMDLFTVGDPIEKEELIISNIILNEQSLSDSENSSTSILYDNLDEDITVSRRENYLTRNCMKSLFSLCVEMLQSQQRPVNFQIKETINSDIVKQHLPIQASYSPERLKLIALQNIKFHLYKRDNFEMNILDTELATTSAIYKVKPLANICFEMISKITDTWDDCTDKTTVEELTINSVNTMSEDAFHNISDTCLNTEEHEEYVSDNEANCYNDDELNADFNEYEDEDENRPEDNWVNQVQLKELKSCFVQSGINNDGEQIQAAEEEDPVATEEHPIIARVKIEPLEEATTNVVDTSIVKLEPVHNLNEMTVIPDSVITKRENVEDLVVEPFLRRASYDGDTFESFVRANKMMHELTEFSSTNDDIFSQSALRVRRQYDPDSDNENYENEPYNSLLVPQTFEPLHIDTAKETLMESSSDDNSAKKSSKKKADKRSRGRPKKADPKHTNKDQSATKEKPPQPPPVNEVAKLTKRMRDKIRQEEKKVQSSDSETENLPLNTRKDKDRKDVEKSKSKSNKPAEDEIQCNNVDSTEQLESSLDKNDDIDKNFTGFTAVDQNEISSYHKYVKFVYDQILPKVSLEAESTMEGTSKEVTQAAIDEDNDRCSSPLINHDDPVEMLECVPTMPIFDDDDGNVSQKAKSKVRSKAKTANKKPEPLEKHTESKETNPEVEKDKKFESNEKEKLIYTERHGWHCYPIDSKDKKLYENAGICLEKLPESFVETYFRYQNITGIRREDEEVDRLINLQSLNRPSINIKEIKTKSKSKVTDGQPSEQVDGCRPPSPANSENYAELTPSEDEQNVDDEIPPLAPFRHSENNLAKDSLMDDNESDSESPLLNIKQEHDASQGPGPRSKKKSKISPKKAEEKVPENPENLMLTADKMMNKELNLLHAPVVLKEEITEAPVKVSTRNKHKSGSKSHSMRERMKADDDSSSEEEKQWVSTKEKLLKRMGKKQDTTSVDDAKRAKLVSEFIERRSDAPESRKRGRGAGRGRRRCSRKMLEREKQLRVLSKELFGENSDATCGRRAISASYFKGRRNIRKVIDKKSLARSTVIANMEEFERKCRLNQRQSKLREELGCEDGVNVLVINGEVCLEYDFEHHQPVVTVHPFFTKVMKAHQYEGVKFMWDACFESLEKIDAGHLGGGCILAHCMGLGKTLQVLALLHTVLTHPRVGMRRVLVCCPLSTVLNWVDEIHKWIGPVTNNIKVFELSKLKKTYERAYQLEDWYSGGGIFIIGYELFRSLSTLDPVLDDIRPTIVNKIRTALLDPGPDIIVCDEGHLLKNDCSVLAVAMSRVVTKRRIVLTGTPMQNNLREYYCMVNFVKPNLLGTYSEYSNRFENPIMNGQHRDSQEEDIKLMKQRTHILHKVLEGCLQRQEASVLYPYLPKKHEYTVFISLTKCQWDLYKHYLQNYAKESKQSILKDFHILQKIWSHPQVLHNFQMRTRDGNGNKIKPEKLEDDLATEDLAASEDMKPIRSDTEIWWLEHLDGGNMLDILNSSNKFLVVFRILEESVKLGDKVLIFSTSLITMDSLEFFLKKINKWSLGQDYYRLDGSVPPEVRQKWCREFNAENNHKTKLFLISTRAGSLGLNMVAANRVIILDTSWNPAHDIQSIFRVYRFGQKKDCYIYRLVALGTMEQKIYERSVTKQAVACRVVDEQQIDRHYNMAELTELYGYDETGVGVAGGVAIGVTDVALLRVARDSCLHAVHEHDSLLRGSSEQGLPEHERAEAWMQFQEEHAHKQMQNKLTPSFSYQIPAAYNIHMNTPNSMVQIPKKQPPEQEIAAQSIQQPQIKAVSAPNDTDYVPQPEPKVKKGKGKAHKKKSDIHLNKEQPPNELSVEDDIVKKIMDILIQHNFQDRQGPKEIADLVSNVRKIVAYGKIPKGSFNKELTQSIANVLLGKEAPQPPPQPPPPPALPDVPPEIETRKQRGRPKKRQETESFIEETPQTAEEPVEIDGRKRRKAAIAAERQLDSIADEPIIDLDRDDDWHEDNDGYKSPEIVPSIPETTIKKEIVKKEKVKPKIQKESKKQLNTEINSILLSDDDEPVKAVDKSKPAETKKDEVVPLHPSLLSNKNFIKIVAHTYLEGNPMLDEDAATLAAQYSTQKALNELESTGKSINSGPIYDIAVKVLGIEILKKLHKSNPQTKKVDEPAPAKPWEPEVKLEPITPFDSTQVRKQYKPKGKVTAKGISELMAKPETPAAPPPAAATTTTRFAVAGPSSAASPGVVPVGLFKRAINITPDEPEESILPDDDDVHIVGDSTPAPAPRSIIRKNAKELVLNSVISKTEKTHTLPTPTSFPQTKTAPKRVITLDSGVITTSPATKLMPKASNAAPIPATSQSDTICLDSDEEVTPEPAPLPRAKRVAMKSTAKKQTVPQVVPVSLTAANPQLNEMLSKQMPFNMTSFDPQMQLNQNNLMNLNQSLPPNKYVVITQSQLNQLGKLPNGIPQLVQRLSSAGASQAAPSQLNTAPQNMNYANSVPQNINMMTSLPQNFNMMTSTPQNVMSSMSQNVMSSMPQNIPMHQMHQNMAQNVMNSSQMNTTPLINIMPQMQQMNAMQMNTMPQMNAMPQMTGVPQNANTNAESILPTQAPPIGGLKTVCKPGDILRITKTGQVEILNRAGANSASPTADTGPASTTKSKKPPSDDATDHKKPSTRRSRIRVLSSSSSSSDSSRSPSPNDPLSILKDVVHIKAVDDILNSNKSQKAAVSKDKVMIPSKDRVIGSTSITKSSASSSRNKVEVPKTNVTITSNKDKVANQINEATSILKKLSNYLGTESKTSKDKKNKMLNTKASSYVESVDLTEIDTPSTSKAVSKSVPKHRSLLVDKKKEQPSKIVGTSKNIIISGNGKASTMSLADSGKKAIRVTNMEKVVPAPTIPGRRDNKKRPTTAVDTNPIKKKKNEPMTLKDFDIDDIDDIIELD